MNAPGFGGEGKPMSIMCRWMLLIALANAWPVLATRVEAETAEADKGWGEMGVATLAADHPAHWVWVADISFFHMTDGRAYLVDADTGAFKGQLSTGGLFMQLNIPVARSEVYSAGTYYSRGTYGERTDVLTIHDTATLAPVAEVVLPPKRLTGMPMEGFQALTDGERFLAITNMTPAQSVTVVDLEKRSVSAEIPTPGCTMVYADGERSFHQLCSSGRLQSIQLAEDGSLASSQQSEPFFSTQDDPITEKGARLSDSWVHVSFSGDVYELRAGEGGPLVGEPWSMLSDADRAEAWRPGGIQHLVAHIASGRVYSLMHRGGEDTHKDPGSEVWVYDIAAKKRIQRIVLKEIATSIQVTQDDAPLLLTTFAEHPALVVYDARSGEYQRTIEGLGETPLIIQTQPRASQ